MALVPLCVHCGRGHSGYLNGFKTLENLSLDEVVHEIRRYEIKLDQIDAYVAALVTLATTPNGAPRQVPYACGMGTRAYKSRTCDLEQLSLAEARAARKATVKDLIRLRAQRTSLETASAPPLSPAPVIDPANGAPVPPVMIGGPPIDALDARFDEIGTGTTAG